MSQTDFRALCASLCADSPDKITKPRIGDVFRVSGFWLEDQMRHGLKVKQLEANSCVLLARGEISRPGDFADKIFYLNKEYSKEDQKKKRARKAEKAKANGLKGKSAEIGCLINSWKPNTGRT